MLHNISVIIWTTTKPENNVSIISVKSVVLSIPYTRNKEIRDLTDKVGPTNIRKVDELIIEMVTVVNDSIIQVTMFSATLLGV